MIETRVLLRVEISVPLARAADYDAARLRLVRPGRRELAPPRARVFNTCHPGVQATQHPAATQASLEAYISTFGPLAPRVQNV